jgi:hypothetical protein
MGISPDFAFVEGCFAAAARIAQARWRRILSAAPRHLQTGAKTDAKPQIARGFAKFSPYSRVKSEIDT